MFDYCLTVPLTSIFSLTRKRRFPPKVKLLSEDEYYEQGAKETRKALDELRGYCSSPDCNQWKTVIHLKDPVRYAHTYLFLMCCFLLVVLCYFNSNTFQ